MHGPTNAGGSASAKGFIQTTYPDGFICTCSNGTRTLKAKDTSGYMMFILPAIGKWTVTATDPADPTNIDSETVEITTEGQSVSVELSFWDGSTLYDSGNEYDNITGGWVVFGDATKEAAYLNTICNPNSDAGAFTDRKIDLTKYNNLNYAITDIKTDWMIWITEEKPTSVETSYGGATTKYQAKSNGTGSLDISAINSEVYIAVGDYSTSSNAYGANVTKIWLS